MTGLNGCACCLIICYFLAVFSACISACPAGCSCISVSPHLTSCIKQNLTEFPKGIPEDTDELYIKGNSIKTLSQASFDYLGKVKRLVFTYNKLESIEGNTFVNLLNLTHLDLRYNLLTSLPSFGFGELRNLKKLNLDYNNIETIADSAFTDLNLTTLGLEKNDNLMEIHVDAFLDSSVSNLFLFGSNLESLSVEAFRHLKSSLHELYWISNKQPVSLPVDLFQGFQFTRLYLERLGLRDASFLKHVTADTLSLDGNPIGPVDFSRFKSLYGVYSLHLDDTNFFHLEPQYFQGLKQLQILHLRNNGITTLADGFKLTFAQLTYLKLDENPFHCNCKLLWFKRFLAGGSKKLKDDSGVQCWTPIQEEISKVDESNFQQCTAPRLINITANVTFRLGAKLTLTCIAEGIPAPQISWQLPDGSSKHYSLATNQKDNVTRMDFLKRAAKSADDGIYRCVAVNFLGNDSSETVVKVLPYYGSSSFLSSYNFLLTTVLWFGYFAAGVVSW